MTKDYIEKNRNLWDNWARLHVDSKFYDMETFRKTRNSLKPVELEELGDVAGKTMLHLQCHFGQDSLSWAAKGAEVVGVDLSQEAVDTGNRLAAEMGLKARFVCSNVLDLMTHHQGAYDVVFTSYGVLHWLPDLARWAQVVAHFLEPGGIFYMVEFHPFARMLADDGTSLAYPYFYQETPDRFVETGSYAAPESEYTAECFEWPHTLGDVISSLCQAGLRIEFMHEFPFSSYNCFPFMEEGSRPDQARLSKDAPILKDNKALAFPLMYSIRAHKSQT